MDLKPIDAIIERYRGEKGAAVALLQDIQEVYHYLPREALEHAARQLDIPLGHLYQVATFFKAFSLKPRGEHVIRVCLGTACHVRGGARNLAKLQSDLGIQVGATTQDGRFTLEKVYCLGGCALGPLVVIDGKYYSKMNPRKIETIIRSYITEKSSNLTRVS